MGLRVTKVAIIYYGKGNPKSPGWESCCERIGPASILKTRPSKCKHGGKPKETHLFVYKK